MKEREKWHVAFLLVPAESRAEPSQARRAQDQIKLTETETKESNSEAGDNGSAEELRELARPIIRVEMMRNGCENESKRIKLMQVKRLTSCLANIK